MSSGTRRTRRALGFVGGLVVLALVPAVGLLLIWPARSSNVSARETYEVVGIYPHDFRAQTQGLVYEEDVFYESTGGWGASSLRRVHPRTGIVLQRHTLSDDDFGEGLGLVEDRLVQLTWTSGVAYSYDRDSFAVLSESSYPGQGWGLAYDGEHLVMSDGTAELRFLDPTTLTEARRLVVTDSRGPVAQLNELESVGGEIWANVWKTDLIARISPKTGTVIGYIDLEGLFDHWAWSRLWPLPTGVLNGIAYDDVSGRVFVTGKLWPVVFAIRPEL